MTAIRPTALLLSICLGLSACATRPTDAVLQPIKAEAGQQQISLLAATNRTRDGSGYSSGRSDRLTFEQFRLSIPSNHKRSQIEYPTAAGDPNKSMAITARRTLDTQLFIHEAAIPSDDGTVGIFVHGYNYNYQESLYRLAQITADAPLSGHPILFSWPSEGRMAGYLADRDAALYSRDDLVWLLTSIAGVSPAKRIVLFGHSVGAFLIMETLRQLKLQEREDVLDRLMVVLAAPDIDDDLFRSQIATIGHMKTPITLFVSKDDKALAISSFLGGERGRVGRLDVDNPGVRTAAELYGLRIIDISAIDDPDWLGHDRYAGLFSRRSRDISDNLPGAGAYVFDVSRPAGATPFSLAGTLVNGR